MLRCSNLLNSRKKKGSIWSVRSPVTTDRDLDSVSGIVNHAWTAASGGPKMKTKKFKEKVKLLTLRRHLLR